MPTADASFSELMAHAGTVRDVEHAVLTFKRSVGNPRAAEWACVLRAHTRLRALPNAAVLIEKQDFNVAQALTATDVRALLELIASQPQSSTGSRVVSALWKHASEIATTERQTELLSVFLQFAAQSKALDAMPKLSAIAVLLKQRSIDSRMSIVNSALTELTLSPQGADMEASENIWKNCVGDDGNSMSFELMIAGYARLHKIDAALSWLDRMQSSTTANITAETFNAAFAALLQRSADALRAFETAKSDVNKKGAASAFRHHAEASRNALSHAHLFWSRMRRSADAGADQNAPSPNLRTFALILDLHVCAADFDGALQAADAIVVRTDALPPLKPTEASAGSQSVFQYMFH
jgi:pentatricopeptide repeat protein